MAQSNARSAGDEAGSTSRGVPDDVSVAVIAHNAAETLETCLRGLDDEGFPPERITIYDVASTDGTPDRLAEQRPELPVVRLDANLGPNPARNRAVAESKTPFVIVMDADVQLLPGTAKRLREAIGDNERVAVATPVVLYGDRPDAVQYSRTWVHFLAEASAEVDDKPLTELAGRTERVGLASGCAPMIRSAAAAEVGRFEDRYFFGKTDGEFAYRVTIGGYDIVEPASATVLHHHHHKRGSTYYKHQLRNRWHFMLRDFQLRTLIAILPVLLVHEPALFLLMLVMGKAGDYFGAVGSVAKMVPGLPRDRRGVRRARRRHDWQVLRGDKLVVPPNIEGNAFVGALVSAYRWALAAYWAIARRALGLISRPWPDVDGRVVGSRIPFPKDEGDEAAHPTAA